MEKNGFVGRWIDISVGCLDLLRSSRDLMDLIDLNPTNLKLLADHVQSDDVKA
jgi:hypothetical protein